MKTFRYNLNNSGLFTTSLVTCLAITIVFLNIDGSNVDEIALRIAAGANFGYAVCIYKDKSHIESMEKGK